jgi:hypothetical protein
MSGFGLESGFVVFAHIGTLLDFEHLDLFQHFESVAALDKQYDVPHYEGSAFEIVLLLAIKVHSELPASDEQRFLCVLDFARYGIVNVRLNHLTLGMSHVRHLLREFITRKEPDAGLTEIMRHNDGNYTVQMFDGFDHESPR